jgi:hypothetical protein
VAVYENDEALTDLQTVKFDAEVFIEDTSPRNCGVEGDRP